MAQWQLGVRATWLSTLLLFGLSGCGSDLGKCDVAALGGNVTPGQLAPHTGQLLVNRSCAAGSCHSESAIGTARDGAPAGLNFDVVPQDLSPAEMAKITRGSANVNDNADDMWSWIDDGTMPPEGKRVAPTATEKEAIRNWLACGAEVVPVAPAIDMSGDFNQLFTSLQRDCGACHGAGSVSGQWLKADPCATRAALVNTSATGPSCGPTGRVLVTPGNPDNSLMLQKLEGATQTCGTAMPLGRADAVPSAYAAPLRAWITGGALVVGCP